jgi:Domain of unknown function (DUF4126)
LESLLGIPVGLALSTAAGLRVFIPLLLTGLAGRFGYLPLTPGMSWLASDMALLALATATLLEVGGYYVPWLDNLLDTMAQPVAVIAGVVATAAVTPELSPFLRWTLAIIAGGGLAGLVQAGTAMLRLKSSVFTGGVGNPVVATVELMGSLALSALAVLAPLLALAAVVVALALLAWRLAVMRRRHRERRA